MRVRWGISLLVVLAALAVPSAMAAPTKGAAQPPGQYAVLFCGDIVGGKCQPQYQGRIPSSAPNWIAGVVWRGAPVGGSIFLAIFNATTRKLAGKTSPARITASSGGVAWRFKGGIPKGSCYLFVPAINGTLYKYGWKACFV